MVSTRRSQCENKREYREGDRVEVLRHDGIANGTLLYKTATKIPQNNEPAVSPFTDRWMVSIQGKDNCDVFNEDISERMIGRVLSGEHASVGTDVVNTTAPLLLQTPTIKKPIRRVSTGKRKLSTSKKSSTKKNKKKAKHAVRSPAALREIAVQQKIKTSTNVVRLKMSTGTLFLFQDGPRRSAQFVWSK